eukprot:SAG11_NODE_1390_length_5055_cov_2.299637_7_plen_77_part_01
MAELAAGAVLREGGRAAEAPVDDQFRDDRSVQRLRIGRAAAALLLRVAEPPDRAALVPLHRHRLGGGGRPHRVAGPA